MSKVRVNSAKNISKDNLEAIRKIFFECSGIKKFNSEDEKDLFFQRWCGLYLQKYPDTCYYATKNNQLLGYILGCLDSEKFLHEVTLGSLLIFKEYFKKYPAHLHINIDPKSQGLGIGSLLIKHLINKESCNFFIVTGAGQSNIEFYKKLSFKVAKIANYSGSDCIFMTFDK